ncbi:MAG: hypothetical protein ABSH34_26330 [Verrucomicrobiota bacterium]
MSNGFVQRGGWWVVGQFMLLLAVAILGVALKLCPGGTSRE